MSQDLAQALKNPSVVLLSGPRSSTRNSTKKANGLLRFGAGLMLGAALLSPLNALAQSPSNTLSTWEQTTEVVAQADQTDSGMEIMTVRQLQRMQADGETPDWFRIEVEGRNWHNSKVDPGTSVDVPTWIQHGEILSPEQALQANQLLGTDVPVYIEIGGGSSKEKVPEVKTLSSQESLAQLRAKEQQEEIASRRNGEKFELGRNSMNFAKGAFLGSKSFEDATPKERTEYVSFLVKNAYIEMQAGHTIQSPSQRLMDTCQHVEEVARSQGPTSQIEHSRSVFSACQSDQMQSNMLTNTVTKTAATAGILLGAVALKAIALVGLFDLGRAWSGPSAAKKEDDLATRLAARRLRASGDPSLDPEAGPIPEVSRPSVRMG